MSIFSDYEHGALSDYEYQQACAEYDREEKAHEAQMERGEEDPNDEQTESI